MYYKGICKYASLSIPFNDLVKLRSLTLSLETSSVGFNYDKSVRLPPI